MGKNKIITSYDLRTYKKLPNRKKAILTNDFLITFRDELIDVFTKNGDNRDLTKETYWSFYSYIEESYGVDKALEIACKKHNLTKAIYEYGRNMVWYEYDEFAKDLIKLMVDRGIIEEGEYDEFNLNELNDDDGIKYKLVEYQKGYNVVRFNWCFKDDIELIENLYSDDKRELIWI